MKEIPGQVRNDETVWPGGTSRHDPDRLLFSPGPQGLTGSGNRFRHPHMWGFRLLCKIPIFARFDYSQKRYGYEEIPPPRSYAAHRRHGERQGRREDLHRPRTLRHVQEPHRDRRQGFRRRAGSRLRPQGPEPQAHLRDQAGQAEQGPQGHRRHRLRRRQVHRPAGGLRPPGGLLPLP